MLIKFIQMEFDFVIVGDGSAGCVLANRLSGLPNAPSVCLIERGPSHSDSRWSVAMPSRFAYNSIFENQRDLWLRYQSEPEKELNSRRIDCPRGTGWGGSSAVNGMQFVRGQQQDFNGGPKRVLLGALVLREVFPLLQAPRKLHAGIRSKWCHQCRRWSRMHEISFQLSRFRWFVEWQC